MIFRANSSLIFVLYILFVHFCNFPYSAQFYAAFFAHFPVKVAKHVIFYHIRKNPALQDSPPAAGCVSNIYHSAAVQSSRSRFYFIGKEFPSHVNITRVFPMKEQRVSLAKLSRRARSR